MSRHPYTFCTDFASEIYWPNCSRFLPSSYRYWKHIVLVFEFAYKPWQSWSYVSWRVSIQSRPCWGRFSIHRPLPQQAQSVIEWLGAPSTANRLPAPRIAAQTVSRGFWLWTVRLCTVASGIWPVALFYYSGYWESSSNSDDLMVVKSSERKDTIPAYWSGLPSQSEFHNCGLRL